MLTASRWSAYNWSGDCYWRSCDVTVVYKTEWEWKRQRGSLTAGQQSAFKCHTTGSLFILFPESGESHPCCLNICSHSHILTHIPTYLYTLQAAAILSPWQELTKVDFIFWKITTNWSLWCALCVEHHGLCPAFHFSRGYNDGIIHSSWTTVSSALECFRYHVLQQSWIILIITSCSQRHC